MRTRFILRFDDICPTMNWQIWQLLEHDLCELDIKPILAVVPDNRDKELMVSEPGVDDFWKNVRCWQRRGWTIGLHGYQHRYVTNVAGRYGTMPRSEFAGLPHEIQEIKLRNAMGIFREQGVSPEVWVAPAHSFDATTVSILSKLGVRIISDGYAIRPYQDSDGITWIPQQFGKFRKLPFGVWTICCHFNQWTVAEIASLTRSIVELPVPETLHMGHLHRFGPKNRMSVVYRFASGSKSFTAKRRM